jgi:uncharacterized SAM-binding protein YcdF (DUF218 family)
MFFFLSKTLNYLTMPLVIIVLCFVFSSIIKKSNWKKWSFRIGLGLLLFCSNEFIANEVISAWELPATPFDKINKRYEWGILLTGVAKSKMEPRDRVHFSRGADRVIHTIQLYKMGIIRKVLISGGNGRLVEVAEQEADELARAMVMLGVPQHDIVTEIKSRNTHESAYEVVKIMNDTISPAQCLLITSGYHMRRSKRCFSKVGLELDTFSADILGHKRIFSFDVLFIPKIDAVVLWHTLVKEWTGMTAYWVAGYI